MLLVPNEKRHFPQNLSIIQNEIERILSLITESYILLGKEAYLNLHASNVISFLSSTVCNVRPRGAVYLTLVLEALLRKFPTEGGQLLLQEELATRMLKSCMWNYIEDDENREVDSVIVVSRFLIIHSTSQLCHNLFSNIHPFTDSKNFKIYVATFVNEVAYDNIYQDVISRYTLHGSKLPITR